MSENKDKQESRAGRKGKKNIHYDCIDSLSARVWDLRKNKLKVNQDDFIEYVKEQTGAKEFINRDSLSQLEANKNIGNFSLINVMSIAKACGVSIGYLVGENDRYNSIEGVACADILGLSDETIKYIMNCPIYFFEMVINCPAFREFIDYIAAYGFHSAMSGALKDGNINNTSEELQKARLEMKINDILTDLRREIIQALEQ